jgi:hypothetical protein
LSIHSPSVFTALQIERLPAFGGARTNFRALVLLINVSTKLAIKLATKMLRVREGLSAGWEATLPVRG